MIARARRATGFPIRPARALLVLAAVAAGSWTGGCSTRNRSNPLDPHNRHTAGSIPGFDAFATNGAVALSWTPLALQGVLGYRVLRSRPGQPPVPLSTGDYPNTARFAEDRNVVNDSTYIYRLVAHLSLGDSAMSPPDTATPGTRRIVALGAADAALAAFSPDGRDLLYALGSEEAYEDMEMDRNGGILWLLLSGSGYVVRRTLDGYPIGVVYATESPSDVGVSPARGFGWVASPSTGVVRRLGPSLNDASQDHPIAGLGHPRVVEAGELDPSAWIGNDEGQVWRYRASDLLFDERWELGDPIRAIALDETESAAWVATQRGTLIDLHYITAGDTSRTLVRAGLSNVVDIAVDPITRTLWVSERGVPGARQGRLSRISLTGQTLAALTSLEPFGIDVDPLDGSCWVSDLASGRLLRVNADGTIQSRSAPLAVPYAVRVWVP